MGITPLPNEMANRFSEYDGKSQTIAEVFRMREQLPILITKAIKMGYDDGWSDCNDSSASETPHVTVEDVMKAVGGV